MTRVTVLWADWKDEVCFHHYYLKTALKKKKKKSNVWFLAQPDPPPMQWELERDTELWKQIPHPGRTPGSYCCHWLMAVTICRVLATCETYRESSQSLRYVSIWVVLWTHVPSGRGHTGISGSSAHKARLDWMASRPAPWHMDGFLLLKCFCWFNR